MKTLSLIDAADPIFHPIHLVPRWDRTSTYTMKQQQDRILIYGPSSSKIRRNRTYA
jgi:hypothetical protein